jgi:hypothetical protein
MTDPTAPAAQSDEDHVSLLDSLADLGDTLTQSDLPVPSKVLHTVGAIVKVLENAGVKVADELYPAEPEPVSRPETQQAVNQKATESRLGRLEDALERVLGHLENKSAEPAPAEPAPADPPPPPPGDTSGSSS